MKRSKGGLVLAVVVVGCAPETSPPSVLPTPAGPEVCVEGEPGCIGWVTCSDAFEKDDGGTCREIVPLQPCPSGTMPLLGARGCVPVGPAACAPGFFADPSGWGCRAILPERRCTGSTRDVVGEASCLPVGSCDVPFPPPGATLIVSKGFSDAELGPTKFKTIGEAMTAARAGSVVAIDSGTYAEGLVMKSNVTVIGRCAAEVHLDGSQLEVHGVLADGAKNAVVSGVTLAGHYEGVRAMRGATVKLSDVIVEGARFAGLIAWRAGSSISGERVVVRGVKPHASQSAAVASVNADEGGLIELVESAVTDNFEAALLATNAESPATPSTLRIKRSVIRDTNIVEHSRAGAGVVASGDVQVEIEESAIVDTRRLAATTLYDGRLVIARSEIRGTMEDTGKEISGAVHALTGHVELEDVTISDAAQSGVLARKGGSVVARGLVVRATRPGGDGAFGMGAWADTGGTLDIERAAFVDNAYYGVSVLDAPSRGSFRHVLVRGTVAQKIEAGGLGRGINVEDGATVELEGVSIVENDGEGLFVRGERKGGKRASVVARRLIVADGRTFDATGVFVALGATADLEDAAIVRAVRAGMIVNETLGEEGSSSEASILHVVVRDTRSHGKKSDEAGSTTLDGIGIGNAGKLTLRSSALSGNRQFGLIVGNERGTALVENSTIQNTQPIDGAYGHGIIAFTKSRLVVSQTEIARNQVGILTSGAAAILRDSRVRANAIGLHAQQGSFLVTGPAAPEEPEDGIVFVTDDSQFVDNGARTGGGDLPVPTDPFADAEPAK